MLVKTNDKVMLSDKAYRWGKKLVQVILPAIASLYFGLAKIWGLPDAEEVVGSIAVITTFLGVVLGVSSMNYDASGAAFDGDLHILPDPEGPVKIVANLPNINSDTKSVTLKVNAPALPPASQD